jgi:anti-sigma factor RsiW
VSHLDDLAAALADGELGHDARDRALAHLAGCAECRADVDLQRRIKALLANQPDPEPPQALVARLQAIATTIEPPPVPRAAASRRALRRRTRVVSARRPALTRPRVAVGAVSLVTAALGVAVALGDGEAGRRVRPAVGTFLDEHNATTARFPLEDPATTVVLTTLTGR